MIARHSHPTFAGRDRLVGIERIARDCRRVLSTPPPIIGRIATHGGWERVRRILDDP